MNKDSTMEQAPPELIQRRYLCFNCDGEHHLKDCKLPKNHKRIAEMRKTITTKVGRYHVEDNQKFGHLVPGRISGTLRNALGLKRYELPLHIYRMRLLGYPPGWLEEARISHSGIKVFDSSGNATLDPEEEEGELCEPLSKDKFDIKKILDFPGFNVPTSSRYIEEGHLFGVPPMSEQDSKTAMLQTLAPNAVKAYKRKKLLLFPSSNNDSLQGQAEMELDSGDEAAEFPSIPPLPDDEPPPVVPPPPPPSLPPPLPPSSPKSEEKISISENKTPNGKNNTSPNNRDQKISPIDRINNSEGNKNSLDKSVDSDIESMEVIEVDDIPFPDSESFITIDEEYDSGASSNGSPSLDQLEEKKKLLLNALETKTSESEMIDITDSIDPAENDSLNITEIDGLLDVSKREQRKMKATDANSKKDISIEPEEVVLLENNPSEVKVAITAAPTAGKFDKIGEESTKYNNSDDGTSSKPSDVNAEALKADIDIITPEDCPATCNTPTSSLDKINTLDSKTGHVKTIQYGAPVINIASSYVKLPSYDKFSKDICDVIYFENLPNSTGKFKKISSLLKKAKSVVDKIQDS